MKSAENTPYSPAFLLFLVTLFFAPLAFGTVEAWSIAALELFVCCTAFALFFELRRQKRNLVRVPGLLPLGLLIGWMIVQLIPLPFFLVQLLAPAIAGIYEPAFPAGTDSAWIPLTVMPRATLLELLRIGSYALFYLLTVQLLSSRRRLTATVRWVTFLAMGIAFVAILQKYGSPHKIYWFRETPANAGTVGPWVYHNHYAGFMEMLCPLVLALFLSSRPSVRYRESLRSRIASFFSGSAGNLHVFLGFGLILIIGSVFLSLSRGGVICLSLSLLLFLLLQARRGHRSSLAPLVAACLVALAVSWFGWDPLLAKFNRIISETGGIQEGRLIIWKDSMGILQEFFPTGSGFGTFIRTYPSHRSLPGTAVVDHAHNDYLELLTDGGLIAFLAAAWFILVVLHHGWKKIHIRRDNYSILLSLGALSGLVALLLHGLVDFNMHNGANGLYFFFFCGLLVSASNTRLHYRTRPTLLPSMKEGKTFFVPLIGAMLLLGVVLVHGGAFLARRTYSQVASVYLNRQLETSRLMQIRKKLSRAAGLDPLEGFYPFNEGRVDWFLGRFDQALLQYTRAVRLDPLNGQYLQNLGLIISRQDREQGERLLDAAAERALDPSRLVYSRVDWLLRFGKRKQALSVMREGLRRYPGLLPRLLPLVTGYELQRDEVTVFLAESPSLWIRFGSYMEKRGLFDESEYYRKHALDLLEGKQDIKPWYFSQLYHFYQRRGEKDRALAVLRRGIAHVPDYAPFHIFFGDYYRREGITYRAREEYEQALLLEPGNVKARKKLRSLK